MSDAPTHASSLPRDRPAPRGHRRGGAGGARPASCAGASCRRARSSGARARRRAEMLLDRRGRVSVRCACREIASSRSRAWAAGEVLGEIAAARRRGPHGHRARDGAGDRALAHPRGLRRPVSRRNPRRSRSSGASPALPSPAPARAARGTPARWRRTGRGAGRAGTLAELEPLPAAGQRVRAPASRPSAPSTRSRCWGFLTAGRLRPLPAGPGRWSPRAASGCLLPDDQRRRREGLHPRRPANPRRTCRAGQAFGYESLLDGSPPR